MDALRALRTVALASALVLAALGATTSARVDDDSALARYRRSWNPFAAGPNVPSSNNGVTQYYGNIVQYRLAFEQFLDDTKGFGYAVEVVGIHGLPFRLDGKTIDAGRTSFGLIGVQPTLEYDFTDRIVGAAGVLFTAAAYTDVAAVYPNLSVYYYWNPGGKVLPR